MDKMKILFLDDMFDRHARFFDHCAQYGAVNEETGQTLAKIYSAYDYGEATAAMMKQSFDVVFLDHDLSLESIMCDPETSEELTGTSVAKWMVEFFENSLLPKPQVVLHSLNPEGRKRMKMILRDAGFEVKEIPFTQLSILRI
jgi:hypothetical protein